MVTTFRARVHDALGPSPTHPVGRVLQVGVLSLIVLNVLAIMLETVPGIGSRYAAPLRLFDLASVAIFTVSYLARLWVAPEEARFRHPVLGRLRYGVTGFALIDLVAIVPAYLPLLIPLDLRWVRVLRVARVFRLFKLGRYSESFGTMVNVLRAKKEEMLVGIFLVGIAVVLASTLIYLAENSTQPEVFSSIPASMWWALITLTTVGYGDTYPVTAAGRIIGGLVALLGICVIAVPAAIFVTGFTEEMDRRRRAKVQPCPHCGRDVNASPASGALAVQARR